MTWTFTVKTRQSEHMIDNIKIHRHRLENQHCASISIHTCLYSLPAYKTLYIDGSGQWPTLIIKLLMQHGAAKWFGSKLLTNPMKQL